MTHSLILIDH